VAVNDQSKLFVLLGGGLLLTLAGCAAIEATAPAVTPAMAATARQSVGQLEQGRRLLATRCTNCHSLEPVAKYSPAEWRELVAKMAERSNLSATEQLQIADYLVAARESVLPSGS
jgi:mono/diheme cytochrome c family protein